MNMTKATLARVAVFASAALWVACSEGTAPELAGSAPVTLAITNGTCAAGTCQTFQVLAFPGNQPHTPGGLWSLDVGTMSTESACLTLPDTATFRIIGPSDTVVVRWTQSDSVSVGALIPGGDRLRASPSTRAFVPTRAAGWSITLPGDTVVAMAAPCS
jgi:hypothetical protein